MSSKKSGEQIQRGRRKAEVPLRRRENAGLDQGRTGGDGFGIVDLENGDGGPADRRAADQHGAVPAKMPRPFVPSRVKEANDGAGARILAGDVGALVAVAVKAGQTQIAWQVLPAVVPGLDVIDVERQFAERLRQAAIFAGIVGALPNETDKRFIHGLVSTAGLVERQARLGAEQIDQPADAAVRLKLLLLVLAEPVVLILVEELVHALLVLGREFQVEERAGGRRR